MNPNMRRYAYAQAEISDLQEATGLSSLMVLTMAETLRAVEARKGRVVITPTLAVRERRFLGSGWTQLTVRAETAAKPEWKRQRRTTS